LILENKINPVFCDFELSPYKAEKIVWSEYRGILLEHGLRTRSVQEAEKISGSKKIYHPFWIGYYKKRKGYDFKALDAVSGEIQSVRMRKVFLKAFRQMN